MTTWRTVLECGQETVPPPLPAPECMYNCPVGSVGMLHPFFSRTICKQELTGDP